MDDCSLKYYSDVRVGRSTGYGTRTSHSERSQSFKAIRVKERPPLY